MGEMTANSITEQDKPTSKLLDIRHMIESYKIYDVISQWARETLQHETILARVLAKAVIRGGLRIQSIDPAWRKPGTFELHGTPFVGFVARDGDTPILIRQTALKHLFSVVEQGLEPNPMELMDEYITKQDFKAWLIREKLELPIFWY